MKEKESLMKDTMITPEEVSIRLNIKKQTVWNWCRNGKIPCIKIGKIYRISQLQFDRWLYNKQVKTQKYGAKNGF